MSFVGIDISKEKCMDREIEKGIPLISFVVKEGKGAGFTGPLPLPLANDVLKRETAGSEILYRADYLQGGRKRFSTGTLTAGEKPETFLKMMERNLKQGSTRADIMGIYGYLESHLALCRMEKLASGEIALMEKTKAGAEGCQAADSAYYREILSYVETGRRCLNNSNSISGVVLPVFPQRSVFMTEWYRSHQEKR